MHSLGVTLNWSMGDVRSWHRVLSEVPEYTGCCSHLPPGSGSQVSFKTLPLWSLSREDKCPPEKFSWTDFSLVVSGTPYVPDFNILC